MNTTTTTILSIGGIVLVIVVLAVGAWVLTGLRNSDEFAQPALQTQASGPLQEQSQSSLEVITSNDAEITQLEQQLSELDIAGIDSDLQDLETQIEELE